jgi:hypothetical protein
MPIRGHDISPLKNELHHTKNCPVTSEGISPMAISCDGWDSGAPRKLSCGQNKTPTAFAIGVSEFNLDDDLLSHGETPHYHRRCIVSLLSSGWDQVVPTLYGRQEIRVLSRDQMASLQQIGYVIVFGVL